MRSLTALTLAIVVAATNSCSKPGGTSPQGDASTGNASTGNVTPLAGEVVLHGGYDTDPRDHGRPVVLIAAALDLEPQVFRNAFSGVTPSRDGPPSGAEARANKKVLMDALGPHGVTNDRLDDVSDYYRYRREAGEVWNHTPAAATAILENGKVIGFDITNSGSGYTTAPTVKVAGHPDIKTEVTIEFSTDFNQNGRVTAITLIN